MIKKIDALYSTISKTNLRYVMTDAVGPFYVRRGDEDHVNPDDAIRNRIPT